MDQSWNRTLSCDSGVGPGEESPEIRRCQERFLPLLGGRDPNRCRNLPSNRTVHPPYVFYPDHVSFHRQKSPFLRKRCLPVRDRLYGVRKRDRRRSTRREAEAGRRREGASEGEGIEQKQRKGERRRRRKEKKGKEGKEWGKG